MKSVVTRVGSRSGRVLELLNIADRDGAGLSALEVADRAQISRQNAQNALKLLIDSGLIYRAQAAGSNKAALYRPVKGLAHVMQQARQSGRAAITEKNRRRQIKHADPQALHWRRTAATGERDTAENRWLDHWLSLWGRWMHSHYNYAKLGYPRQCAVLQGGWLVRESEELADAADLRVVHAVDAIIDGLPESQRAAVWTSQGLCVAPKGAWIIDALQWARAAIYEQADKRGVVVL